MAGCVEIGADSLGDVGVDGKRVAPAAFAGDAQRVVPAVLVQISDRECGDFGAAETDLQTDRQDCPITQSLDGILSWMVKDFPGIRLRKRQRP